MTDLAYRTFPYRFTNAGIIARDVYDRLRPGTYRNLENVESRQENSLATRYGLAPISTDLTNNFPLGNPVQSLSRMQSLANPYNYAAAGPLLFRKATDAPGAYTQIASALSGNRTSMFPYRPSGNSNPYMFIADALKMLKDNGTGNAQNWGIAPPLQPALVAPVQPSLLDIELFDEAVTTSFTLANLTGAAMLGRVQTTMVPAIPGAGVQFVQVSANGAGPGALVRAGGTTTANVAAHGYVSGMRVQIVVQNPADSSFAVSSAVITVLNANQFTYVNPGANGANVGIVTISGLPSLEAGMSVTTTDVNAETVFITEVLGPVPSLGLPGGFIATFTKAHAAGTQIVSNYLSGSVAANTTATITKQGALNLSFPSLQTAADQNYVQLYVLVDNPLAILQATVLFDVGDGTFSQDYYSKAVSMSPAQPAATGGITASAAQTAAVFQRAGGAVNFSTLGGDNPSILPDDYPLLQQLQSANLDPGGKVWTLIQIPLANFVANGAAGGPNNGWSNVVAWRVSIQTQANLAATIGVDDLAFVGGSDLNSFAGQAYDYRYTYENLNTGCESNPSQMMVGVNAQQFNVGTTQAAAPVPLSVQQQAIQVTAVASPDPQVTHWNLYRRGGTLTQAWYFVAQIPIGTLTYTDVVADSVIENNNQLNINQDAPVTTTLQTPINTTGSAGLQVGVVGIIVASGTFFPGQTINIGSGATLEQAYVLSVPNPTVINVYLQIAHGNTYPITATSRPQTPMNLMAIAFDKAWLAGDPVNPHVLYYSTTFQPETFPQQNSLEVGTPDAPIMALIELNGLLFVFTTKRVYEVLGAGSAVPSVIPTACKHGMAAQFAWCTSEGRIYYLSYDGIYVFTGGSAQYLTEPVEWVWTGKNFGPIPSLNLAQKRNVFMGYWNHEIFVSYIDQNSNQHRLIYHEIYNRWRNDDQAFGSITSMYLAEDTGALYVGKSDGMVYQDRINDYDSGGFVGGTQVINPINFSIQTAQMDQSEVEADFAKRQKVYNEVTLDADLDGQTVTVSLVFDNGATVTPVGTITGTGRQQYNFNVGNGNGYRSLNVGLLLSGSVEAVVTFFEIHIRAVPEAEYRLSWDTYWLGHGVDEWKLTKQIFAEYFAGAPILVNVFLDGNMAAPAFTFQLSATTGLLRASRKVRFPATKYRLIRFVGTSNANFSMYDDTQIETKLLGSGKGYQRSKISP